MPEQSLAPFIAGRACITYVIGHMARIFPILLLALSLVLSPLAMGGSGAAHAAVPHAASSTAHCPQEAPAPSSQEHAPGMKAGCAIACAAMPAAEPVPGDQLGPEALAPAPLVHQRLAGIHPEGETPPPRMHPEI